MPRSMASTKVFGRVGDCPGLAFVFLLLRGQFADVAAQPFRVAYHFKAAVSVHDGIIPGRHDFLPVCALVGYQFGVT